MSIIINLLSNVMPEEMLVKVFSESVFMTRFMQREHYFKIAVMKDDPNPTQIPDCVIRFA